MCITSDAIFMLMVSIRNSKCALPRIIVWTARRLDSGTPLPLPQTSLPWHHRPQPVSAGSGGTSQGAGAPCWAIRATPGRLATRTARQTVNPHRWRSRSREITARSCTTSNASADPTGAFIVSRTCRHIQGLSRSENLAANHRLRRIADLCIRTAHSLFLAEC